MQNMIESDYDRRLSVFEKIRRDHDIIEEKIERDSQIGTNTDAVIQDWNQVVKIKLPEVSEEYIELIPTTRMSEIVLMQD